MERGQPCPCKPASLNASTRGQPCPRVLALREAGLHGHGCPRSIQTKGSHGTPLDVVSGGEPDLLIDFRQSTTHTMKRKTWRIAGINFDHFHMGDLLRYAHNHSQVEVIGISDEQ